MQNENGILESILNFLESKWEKQVSTSQWSFSYRFALDDVEASGEDLVLTVIDGRNHDDDSIRKMLKTCLLRDQNTNYFLVIQDQKVMFRDHNYDWFLVLWKRKHSRSFLSKFLEWLERPLHNDFSTILNIRRKLQALVEHLIQLQKSFSRDEILDQSFFFVLFWKVIVELIVTSFLEFRLISFECSSGLLATLDEFFSHFSHEKDSIPFQKREEIFLELRASLESWIREEMISALNLVPYLGIIHEEIKLWDQRKKLGAFYTPRKLCWEIVDETLKIALVNHLQLEEETRNALPRMNLKDLVAGLSKTRRFDMLEAIKQIRVLDPSMGTGNFLLAAMSCIKRHVLNQQGEKTNERVGDLIVRLYLELFPRIIHGLDMDTDALMIARLRVFFLFLQDLMWMDEASVKDLLSVLKLFWRKEWKFHHGNALIGYAAWDNLSNDEKMKFIARDDNESSHLLVKSLNDRLTGELNLSSSFIERIKPFHWVLHYKQPKFSVIIGNPPWIQSKFIDKQEKKWHAACFTTIGAQYDYFQLFMERAEDLLDENGVLGFIVPNRFVNGSNYQKFREFLLRSSLRLWKIVNLGDGVFDGVNMPSCIMYLARHPPNDGIFALDRSKPHPIKPMIELSLTEFRDFVQQYQIFPVGISRSTMVLLRSMKKGSVPVRSLFKNGRGVEIGKKCQIILQSPILNSRPFLIGEDLIRYAIRSRHHLQLGAAGINYKPMSLYDGKKVLVRKTGATVSAIVDHGEHVVIQVIYVFKSKSPWIFSEEMLVALLNSTVMNWYFHEISLEGKKTSFPHLRQRDILSFPLKINRWNKPLEKLSILNQFFTQLQYLSLLFLRDENTREINVNFRSEKEILELTRFLDEKLTNVISVLLFFDEMIEARGKQYLLERIASLDVDRVQVWFQKLWKVLLLRETGKIEDSQLLSFFTDTFKLVEITTSSVSDLKNDDALQDAISTIFHASLISEILSNEKDVK